MADDNGRLFPARVYEKKGKKIVWVEEIYKESAREKKRSSSIEACFDYRLRHGWMRILIHGERKKKKKERIQSSSGDVPNSIKIGRKQ